MKIIILPIGYGKCPKCKVDTDFFADFYRDDDGVKWPMGVNCGNCDEWFSDEEFSKIIQSSSRSETK